MVASLRRVFEDTAIVVVTHYSGLTVADMGQLRAQMRQAGARFQVTKNRLARRALEGTRFQGLGGLFKGPTAIAFSKDPVAAAKVAVTFAKANEKLVVVGGALGAESLDADGVKALAALPSLDTLRGRLVGLLRAPATRVAAVLAAPAGRLARVLDARGRQEAAP
jgi:large subunit ribosomal protein L10